MWVLLSTVLSLALAEPTGDPAETAEEVEAPRTKDIKVPGVDLIARLPLPENPDDLPLWSHGLGDATSEVKLGLRRVDAFTDLRVQVTAYQPDLERITGSLVAWLEAQDEADSFETYTLGETTLLEHERLGPLVQIPFSVRDEHLEQDFWDEVALFSVEGAGVLVTAVSSDSAEKAHEVLAEALDLLFPTVAALGADDLPAGRVETPAGYALEIPTGWRTLTEKEARLRSTVRIAGDGPFSGQFARIYGVDPGELEKVIFECTASAEPTLHVLDPSKSPQAAENFRKFATVQLRGGRVRIQTGSQERMIDVVAEQPVQPEGEGELTWLSLPHRQAYLWRISGTLFDEPVAVSMFYTAWDDVGLLCRAITPTDETAVLGTFESMVRQIEILDSEMHPMPLSMKARYIRWWPTAHPLLQLYWIPIPLLLMAGWLVLRDD